MRLRSSVRQAWVCGLCRLLSTRTGISFLIGTVKKTTVAADEYDGFGRFSSFENLHNQFHEVWGAFDRNGKIWDIEAGAGLGLTAGSDRWTLKLMISRDINN